MAGSGGNPSFQRTILGVPGKVGVSQIILNDFGSGVRDWSSYFMVAGHYRSA
jgi:hypothetical protein